MHPWIWDAARSLWQSGHFREAVRAASVKVNAELQNKVGRRDASEVALFQQSFSDDLPAPGKPRLRPENDDGGKTSLSLRRGIVAFAEGCYSAIRNPASHDEGDLQEQIAMEQLAALSVLARWLDGATVESA
nr:TIGR02391 family protein [Cryobacterium sp. BB307]